MRVIDVRNVHQALPEACYQLSQDGVLRQSRNGRVIAFIEPVTTVFRRPRERVLFWAQRDANPFFHLFESIWMLEGRNDLAFVEGFNKKMAAFSDDGMTLNGAYGHRWRDHFGRDQLKVTAAALRENPDCRRQVVTMWDPIKDLGLDSRDLPCNTQIYFQCDPEGWLDMMVTNRSNDLIWGAYGANAVHFSFLQEYMAGLIGCDMGTYWHTSMNTHVYLENHSQLLSDLADEAPQPPAQVRECPYSKGEVCTLPSMMTISSGRWHRDLDGIMKSNGDQGSGDPFLGGVVAPMLRAWLTYKAETYKKHEKAMKELENVIAPDWQRASMEWIERRAVKSTSLHV